MNPKNEIQKANLPQSTWRKLFTLEILFLLSNVFMAVPVGNLRQDEQDGQDAGMEDQELTKGAGAGVKQGEIEG